MSALTRPTPSHEQEPQGDSVLLEWPDDLAFPGHQAPLEQLDSTVSQAGMAHQDVPVSQALLAPPDEMVGQGSMATREGVARPVQVGAPGYPELSVHQEPLGLMALTVCMPADQGMLS